MSEAFLRAADLRAVGDRYPNLSARPSERRMFEADDATAHRALVQSLQIREASSGEPVVHGLASRTEWGYEMYDWAGPYTEVVDLNSFDATLAASPLVEFTLNHNRGGGAPMAHTRNQTLTLGTVMDGEETGLTYEALVDPTRNDVSDMLKALERGDLAEASFKFRIVRGQWSPDYTEYRITEADLHRGDVSAVNFGANPAATSGLRSLPQSPRAVRVEIPDAYTRPRRAI